MRKPAGALLTLNVYKAYKTRSLKQQNAVADAALPARQQTLLLGSREQKDLQPLQANSVKLTFPIFVENPDGARLQQQVIQTAAGATREYHETRRASGGARGGDAQDPRQRACCWRSTKRR